MKACTLPIAIIGVGCRLPGGVRDLPSLWDVLLQGRDCITAIPSTRWDTSRFTHPERTHPGTSVTSQAGIIENIYAFDADFFGISPKEAEAMDPQQRLLLELTWEAFENAGLNPLAFSNSDTGVFVGAASPDGGTCHADDICATSPYSMTGTNLSIIANRISYIYNFHGPSFTLDTACSSSLYALHQACQSLASGASDYALACGVNVLLAPYPFVGFSQAYMLSPEGRCKVFDASGNGYVRSEGGGVLLLEPLALARKRGHHVHAVIEAIACNSDGRTQGIALPSCEAQEQLLRLVYEEAQPCSVDDLCYVEAHGTGTVVGDPLEAKAIGQAIARQRKDVLPIGSVKCNVGHLETASGMAGICKALLVLQKRIIPKQIHIQKLNPSIDYEHLHLHVPLENEPIPSTSAPLRVGVNSFGFGGANGHVVLREGDAAHVFEESSATPPLFLSARSEQSLTDLAHSYADRIEEAPTSYAALARGAAQKRPELSYRLVVDGDSALAIAKQLREATSFTQGSLFQSSQAKPKCAFVYAGNGCHWVGMGRDLMNDAVFASKAREIASIFATYANVDLLNLLETAQAADLEKTEITQPLIFLIQVALTELLTHQGITPDVVYGHSVGEVAAVHAAGLVSLADAVKIVYFRSLCQAKTRGTGKMAAAKLKEEEAKELARTVGFGEVEVAGINAPGSLTLSGSERGLRAMGEVLSKQRSFFKMLPLEYAFHSILMEPIREELLRSLVGIEIHEAKIPFFSTVGGDEELLCAWPGQTSPDIGAEYWWRNIRKPVLFAKATREALAYGVRYFLEISPHAILQQYLRSVCKAEEVAVSVGGTMQRGSDNFKLMSRAWKTLWMRGWPLDLAKKVGEGAQSLDLPLYPWNRKVYEIAPTSECTGYLKRSCSHPLLGLNVGPQSFESVLDTQMMPWLADHCVGTSIFYPAACYLEMAFAAALEWQQRYPLELTNTTILRPVLFDGAHSIKLRTTVELSDGELQIHGRPYGSEEAWVLHSRGRIVKSSALPHKRVDLSLYQQGTHFLAKDLYQETLQANMHYGEAFQPVLEIWQQKNVFLASLKSSSAMLAACQEGMLIAPPLLDGGLQLIFFAIARIFGANVCPRLPYWFDRCVLFRAGHPSYALLTLEDVSERNAVCSLNLLDDKGDTLLFLEHGRARSVPRLGATPLSYVYTTEALSQGVLPFGEAEQERLFAALCASARQEAQKVSIDASFIKRQTEVRPLLSACVLALKEAYQQRGQTLHVPKDFQSYLQKKSDVAQTLPDFATIWQSLLFDAPSESALVALLASVHATLFSGADTTKERRNFLALAFEQEFSSALKIFSQAIKGAVSSLSGGESISIVSYGKQEAVLRILQTHLAHLPVLLTNENESDVEQMALSLAASSLGIRTLWQSRKWEMEVEKAPVENIDLLIVGEGLSSAQNVLQTLCNCADSLKDGGILVALEHEPDPLQDILNGLDANWWKGKDVGSLLPQEQWKEAFLDAGFMDVQFVEVSNCKEDISDASFLLIARKGVPQARAEREIEEVLPKPLGLLCSEVLPSWMESLDFLLAETCAPLQSVEQAKVLLIEAQTKKMPLVLVPFLEEGSTQEAILAVTHVLNLAKAWKEQNVAVKVVLLVLENTVLEGALRGLLRVLTNEMAGLTTALIALEGAPSKELSKALVAELLHLGSCKEHCEREITLSAQSRSVLRSFEWALPKEEVALQDTFWQLDIDDPGHLESLTWHARPKAKPAAGEVLLHVAATGLNFRDVMWAMNLLPEEALQYGFSGPGLGIECTGVVEEVGSGVSDLHVGERVLAFGPKCFASSVLTKASACAKIPADMDLLTCATLPVTFFTAYYALHTLAQLQKGERVLIHGAAGGVGLAAIQIAFALGAQVYATAGSESKRNFLRLLGVEHVYDSRSTSFRDGIMRDTNGEGVDCVLNSLAREAIAQSLECLRPFGRFLELGKSDFYADSPMRLRPFRNNISYFGIDVDQLMLVKPNLGKALFAEMMEAFAAGQWKPLPCLVYAAEQVEEAFRRMQKSQHLGKIVVTPPKNAAKPATGAKAVFVRKGATYLVTGGTAGFGLESARFLAAQGAESLLLLSRSGETAANHEQLQELRKTCPLVTVLAVDVSDQTRLKAALGEVLPTLPPLKGVLHAAAVLDDAIATNLTEERIRRVLTPKVGGAEALHACTKHLSLDFFVLYSSVTTLLGNPGQANYVAANLAMESLVRARRSEGLTGLAVGWGAIGDCGMLQRDAKTLTSLQKMTGIVPLKAQEALERLFSLPQDVPAYVSLFAADWKLLANLPIAKDPRFTELVRAQSSSVTEGHSLASRIEGKSAAEALEIILQEVKNVLARVLRTTPSAIRANQPLQEMGIDSLMGVELSLALEELSNGHPLAGTLGATVTAEDLSQRIFNHLRGESSEEEDMVVSLAQSHGVAVSENVRLASSDVLGGGHE